jgi:hypothetical protein|tara:strand:+ start:233 stop:589 length:357 start_codon:yes stop_codon:yes gene_type:complete
LANKVFYSTVPVTTKETSCAKKLKNSRLLPIRDRIGFTQADTATTLPYQSGITNAGLIVRPLMDHWRQMTHSSDIQVRQQYKKHQKSVRLRHSGLLQNRGCASPVESAFTSPPITMAM